MALVLSGVAQVPTFRRPVRYSRHLKPTKNPPPSSGQGFFRDDYLLRDRSDEAGNQTFGYFKRDYTPRKAAFYLHNLTTILADQGSAGTPSKLKFSIPQQPPTMHDLLLQKSDGTFQLVLWNERLQGSDQVTVRFASKFVQVNIYDPTLGTDVIAKHVNVDSLKLTLSNHPLVLEISSK